MGRMCRGAYAERRGMIMRAGKKIWLEGS